MDSAPPQPHRSSTLPPARPTRPKFNSMLTSDRLRESYLFRDPARTPDPLSKPRRSVFREVGLDDDDASPAQTPSTPPGDVFGSASPVDKATPAWPGEREKEEMKGRASEEAPGPKIEGAQRGGLCL